MYCLFSNYTKMEKKKRKTVKPISVFLLNEHPVTVQPYAVSVKLYFRI